MKKIAFLFMLWVSATRLFSQTTVSFCTYVEQEGYCALNNTKFIASKDSSTCKIFMKVISKAPIGTKVTYKVLTIGNNGLKTQLQVIEQSIQGDWLMAWMPYNFPAGAKYLVEIFNNAGEMLCSKDFELFNFE